MHEKMWTENYCGECDAVLNALFDPDEFWSFKVGRVRCRECGAVTNPCNECFGTDIEKTVGCDNCPWANAEITDEMTEEEVKNAGNVPLMVMPEQQER